MVDLAPFVHWPEGSVHPVIDRERLVEFYSNHGIDVWNIGSPIDLVPWIEDREKYDLLTKDAVPVDIFVWGKGPTPDPRMTKIGGVPFLPRSMPWPEVDGKPTQFVCQFDFRDSKELVPELPGDILLVFARDVDCLWYPEGGGFEFRFVSAATDEDEIIDANDVPSPGSQFNVPELWGCRYRTVDDTSRGDHAYAVSEAGDENACYLPVTFCTKVGGVPYNSQENIKAPPTDYLCQLVSVQPAHEADWPFVNSAEQLNLYGENTIHTDENRLSVGDLGELTFYWDAERGVRTDGSCG